MELCWEKVKADLGSALPASTYSLWIKPLSYVGFQNNEIILSCPNKFSYNWVTENYQKLIEEALQTGTGANNIGVTLKILKRTRKNDSFDPTDQAPTQMPLPSIGSFNSNGGCSALKSDFTFERFIVGPSNEFAYSASTAMANGDPSHYQTLLMLAGTGLGKTHLSHAVGNCLRANSPNKRVLYITAEDFTNEMISALKQKRIEEFKTRYRKNCDVLLLEQVHFLSGKEKTQMELGYTLDALVNANRKVIFTSAMPPKDIPQMSKELTSRLTCGLVSTINSPDRETRLKILSSKAHEKNMALSEEITHFLADTLTRDVRQMESALLSLKAKSQLMKQKIDLELAKEVASSLVSREKALSSSDIRDLVSKYYKVPPQTIASKSRKKIHAFPRNICAYLSRRFTDETLQAIAKTINRSHSTVLYASELIEKEIKTDPKVRHQIEFLGEQISRMKF
ncbi:MAG: chromosomal replication initiator protein DnaA [Desulfatiglandaceae bacterium]